VCERERERERETERETERERQTDRERERQRETERDRERECVLGWGSSATAILLSFIPVSWPAKGPELLSPNMN